MSDISLMGGEAGGDVGGAGHRRRPGAAGGGAQAAERDHPGEPVRVRHLLPERPAPPRRPPTHSAYSPQTAGARPPVLVDAHVRRFGADGVHVLGQVAARVDPRRVRHEAPPQGEQGGEQRPEARRVPWRRRFDDRHPRGAGAGGAGPGVRRWISRFGKGAGGRRASAHAYKMTASLPSRDSVAAFPQEIAPPY
eukprot:gene953-biopygen471